MFVIASLFAIFLASGLILGWTAWRWLSAGEGRAFGRPVSRRERPGRYWLSVAAIASGASICAAAAALIAALVL